MLNRGKLGLTINLIVLGATFLGGAKHGNRIPQFAGPYRAVISYVLNASEDYQSTGKLYLRLRTTQVRGKQLQYGWGETSISVPITDNMKVEIRMASRSNNQWKKNAFVFNFDKACSFFLLHAKSVGRLVCGTDFSCPSVVVNRREIKNQSFEFVFPKFPVMPYGRYLFTLAILETNEVLGVGVADVEIVPRL